MVPEIERLRPEWASTKKRQFRKPNRPVMPITGERNILITSALPYVNNVPHLGTVIGCVLSADVFARYCRFRGYNTLYICGTDEYGTATETKALEEKLTPQQICDKYFQIHKEVYEWFNVDFDYFGRTTTEQQTQIAHDIFLKLYHNGYTTENVIEQFFCTSCERFLADRFIQGVCPFCAFEDARGDQCDACGRLINAYELRNPRCKLCSSTPEIRTSKHVFLNLPKLQPKIDTYLKSQFGNEDNCWTHNAVAITQSWLTEGLKERCITRDLSWGTKVPIEGYENKVFYVWFDAPIGYLSITANYCKDWKKWWMNPNEVSLYNFLGKDNVLFHSIIFPASLIGTGDQYTLINNMSATEYMRYEGQKFSKSRGVGIFGTDAKSTSIPADVWRFYLLFARPESQDSDFSWSDFGTKVNTELLNNLGNFVNRVLSFVSRSFGGVLPDMTLTTCEDELIEDVGKELSSYVASMEKLKIRDALRIVLNISRLGNQYMQSCKPWDMLKGSDADKKRGETVLSLATNVVALLSTLLRPFMPATGQQISEQLNLPSEYWGIDDSFYRFFSNGHTIGKPYPLFQKLEDGLLQSLRTKYAGQDMIRSAKLPPCSEHELNALIKTQGDIVRNLKSSKVEKSVIDQEVKKLLELKAKLSKTANNASGAKTKHIEHNKRSAMNTATNPVGKSEDYQRTIQQLRADILARQEALRRYVIRNQTARLQELNRKLKERVRELTAKLNKAEQENGKTIYYTQIKRNTDIPVANSGLPVSSLNGTDDTVVQARKAKPKASLSHAPNGDGAKSAAKEKTKNPKEQHHKKNEPEAPVDVSRLDIRIGYILSAEKHPDADALYVEQVDVGENVPRTVVSGLVKHVPLNEMQNRYCAVLCNLKPVKMRGVESQAMVLCGSTPEKVEFLDPPSNCVPGDRVTCPEYTGEPDALLNPKKKIWETVQTDLLVNADGFATYKGVLLEVTGKGKLATKTLRNVAVK